MGVLVHGGGSDTSATGIVTEFTSATLAALNTAYPANQHSGAWAIVTADPDLELRGRYYSDGEDWTLKIAGDSDTVTITSGDTTPGHMDDKIVLSGGVNKTIGNEGGNETLNIEVHDRQHALDSTSDHAALTGDEDEFISLNASGRPKASGSSAASFDAAGTGAAAASAAVAAHLLAQDHSKLHDRQHGIASTSDHTGATSAEENELVSFDANGLPKHPTTDLKWPQDLLLAATRMIKSATGVLLRVKEVAEDSVKSVFLAKTYVTPTPDYDFDASAEHSAGITYDGMHNILASGYDPTRGAQHICVATSGTDANKKGSYAIITQRIRGSVWANRYQMQDGDYLAGIGFAGQSAGAGNGSTTDMVIASAIVPIIEGAVSSQVLPTGISFQTSETDNTGLTERLRIKANGLVDVTKLGTNAVVRYQRILTSSQNIVASDYLVLLNAAGEAVNGILPAVTAANKGQEYIIKRINASDTYTASVSVSGGGTIDGATSYAFTGKNDSIKVIAGDSEWQIVASETANTRNPQAVAISTSGDLLASYNGKVLYVDATAGNVTLTAKDTLPLGFNCTVVLNSATNNVILAADTNIRSKDSNLKLASQYGAATVHKQAATVFYAFGDLSA